MKRLQHFFLLAITVFSFGNAAAQYTENDIKLYIYTYKDLAINKMHEYKIPASITIAQGIFESACGTSHLAKDGNNHFGIKCHTGWTGDTILIDDDALQECFRKYQTVEESYNDHSLFLKNRNRYASLFSLDIMDYKGWARGLKAAGYATNPQYADRLINLIEKYDIARLDTIYQTLRTEGYFDKQQDMLASRLEELYSSNLPAATITPKPHAVAQVKETPVEATKDISSPEKTQKPKFKIKLRKVKADSKPDKHDANTTPQETVSSPAPSTESKQPTSNTPATKKQESVTQSQPATSQTTKAPKTDGDKPVTTQAPAHTVYQTNNNEKSQTVKQPANAATEQAEPEELPTKITVFATLDGRYPAVKDYPFTERTVYTNNKVLFVIAQKGDTYQTIAKDVQSKEKKLKKYNDVTSSAKLKVGQVVYIENKRKAGEQNSYTVQNSESPLYISQKTGIQLKKLCKLNKITPQTELKKGKILKLK